MKRASLSLQRHLRAAEAAIAETASVDKLWKEVLMLLFRFLWSLDLHLEL
ncbi:hypothetical protein [Sphingobacterium sp. T2]|nr:hypothetical protein [Sphingobacterium sp. T2]